MTRGGDRLVAAFEAMLEAPMAGAVDAIVDTALREDWPDADAWVPPEVLGPTQAIEMRADFMPTGDKLPLMLTEPVAITADGRLTASVEDETGKLGGCDVRLLVDGGKGQIFRPAIATLAAGGASNGRPACRIDSPLAPRGLTRVALRFEALGHPRVVPEKWLTVYVIRPAGREAA